jgi:hypothetical protein
MRSENKRATLAAGSSAPLAKDSLDPREKELQRIAQLRRDGKHADADEALRIFRRDNPDYRIPDAMWEQVKPDSPGSGRQGLGNAARGGARWSSRRR